MTGSVWVALKYGSWIRIALIATGIFAGMVALRKCVPARRRGSISRMLGPAACVCTVLYIPAFVEVFEIVHVWYFARKYSLLASMASILLPATSLFVTCVILFRRVWTVQSRLRTALMRFGVSACACIYALAVAELLLFCFFTESHGSGATLAAQRWFDKYWRPMNSLGYRDVEHGDPRAEGRRLLCVVGDSFVAGHGIRRASDRFSDILQVELGDDWMVANVARGGWDSGDEYGALVSYPYKPDMVVLAYFINDIAGAAARCGLTNPAAKAERMPRALRPWIEGSFLVNLAYSRWSAYARGKQSRFNVYWEYMYECYSKEDVWDSHRKELLDIVRFCEGRDTKLVVLIIPQLRDVAGSRPITSRVARFFRKHGVRVVDLTEQLSEYDYRELVVNALDAHANESVNRRIADSLHDAIQPPRVASGGT